MDRIQIRNLRRLEDTGKVELKPITLLVGANSSGTSTFLRIFPLFKQSVNAKIIGPILWYGAEVDFGSYNTALRKGASNMEFAFCWEKVMPSVMSNVYSYTEPIRDVSLRIEINADADDAYVNLYEISIGDNIISIVQDKGYARQNIHINGHDPKEYGIVGFMQLFWGKEMLPIMEIRGEGWGLSSEPSELVINFLRGYLKKTSLSSYADAFDAQLYSKIEMSSNIAIAQQLVEKMHIEGVNVETLSKEIGFRNFVEVYLLSNIRVICSNINEQLTEEFNASYYIKPFRASAERYYRWQNLAVDTLDSDGHNMAMYVNNMYKDKKQKQQFIEWTNRLFGFELNVNNPEGHLSLAIKESDKEAYNIADKGYGYSQILPVILALWQIYFTYASSSSFKGKTIFIAIEQPELHLHPKLQAKLMDAFIAVVSTARAKGVDIKLIIETHSPTMINRLGVKIARRQYPNDGASILLFHALDEEKPSPQVAMYDNEGILSNWPAGFFEVE